MYSNNLSKTFKLKTLHQSNTELVAGNRREVPNALPRVRPHLPAS